ncbi:MAG: hypothetical protein AUJ74_02750 [Candidatus Omnitrophica bacterium CG1_02_44_16]|nr:MAG: hypothetical protein AUJ74_02750 [Candidatus Omnitrophica bacterium CG1_02_44_16]
MAEGLGNSPIRTLEPSNGGMGIRLKIAKTTLITIKYCRVAASISEFFKPNLKRIAAAKAHARLASGPASPTQIISFLGFFKAAKLTGMGLAHPKRTGEFIITSIMGKRTVPNGSMWASGFKVSRPALCAVVSPS